MLGGYDPANYTSERIFATAPDGVQVPISLVYRRGIEHNGQSPLYLYGYGSYGILTEPSFSPDRISLLDRGYVYAIAHIRRLRRYGPPLVRRRQAAPQEEYVYRFHRVRRTFDRKSSTPRPTSSR